MIAASLKQCGCGSTLFCELGFPRSYDRGLIEARWESYSSSVAGSCFRDHMSAASLKGFFDYGIADEVHELKGNTAQGAALGTIPSCADRTIVLTGTLNGGYLPGSEPDSIS